MFIPPPNPTNGGLFGDDVASLLVPVLLGNLDKLYARALSSSACSLRASASSEDTVAERYEGKVSKMFNASLKLLCYIEAKRLKARI